MKKSSRLDKHTVGNVGLYYVCYQLSRLGWNAMPTARNARGVDILIYSQDGSRKHTIQVKSLSKRSPVPLGTRIDGLMAEFWVICNEVASDKPQCFVLELHDVLQRAHRGDKEGHTSYWLQPAAYITEEFREAWQRIGSGEPATEQPAGTRRP